jgi:hypothetical protein
MINFLDAALYREGPQGDEWSKCRERVFNGWKDINILNYETEEMKKGREEKDIRSSWKLFKRNYANRNMLTKDKPKEDSEVKEVIVSPNEDVVQVNVKQKPKAKQISTIAIEKKCSFLDKIEKVINETSEKINAIFESAISNTKETLEKASESKAITHIPQVEEEQTPREVEVTIKSEGIDSLVSTEQPIIEEASIKKEQMIWRGNTVSYNIPFEEHELYPSKEEQYVKNINTKFREQLDNNIMGLNTLNDNEKLNQTKIDTFKNNYITDEDNSMINISNKRKRKKTRLTKPERYKSKFNEEGNEVITNKSSNITKTHTKNNSQPDIEEDTNKWLKKLDNNFTLKVNRKDHEAESNKKNEYKQTNCSETGQMLEETELAENNGSVLDTKHKEKENFAWLWEAHPNGSNRKNNTHTQAKLKVNKSHKRKSCRQFRWSKLRISENVKFRSRRIRNVTILKTPSTVTISREGNNTKTMNSYDKFTIDSEVEQLIDEAEVKDTSRSVLEAEHKERLISLSRREASTTSTNRMKRSKIILLQKSVRSYWSKSYHKIRRQKLFKIALDKSIGSIENSFNSNNMESQLKEKLRRLVSKGNAVKIKKPPDKLELAYRNIGRRKKFKKLKEELIFKPMIERQGWKSIEGKFFKNDVHKLIPPIYPLLNYNISNPSEENPNSRIISDAEYAVGSAQRTQLERVLSSHISEQYLCPNPSIPDRSSKEGEEGSRASTRLTSPLFNPRRGTKH